MAPAPVVEPARGRPRRSAAPDFTALNAEQDFLDRAVEHVARPPTEAELAKRKAQKEAAEQRRIAREAAAIAAAAAAPAVEEAEADEGEGEKSETEGDEYRIEQLVVCRTFAKRARFVLVKWKDFDHDNNTWQERKHLHEDAVADYDRMAKLPFALSELLELPPHAESDLLARELLLPVTNAPDDVDDDDDDEEEAADSGVAAKAEEPPVPAAAAAAAAAAATSSGMEVKTEAGVAVMVEAMSDSDDESPAKAALGSKPRGGKSSRALLTNRPPPAPFVPEVLAPLESMLAHAQLPVHELGGSLHHAACLLRSELHLPLASKLQAAVATPPSLLGAGDEFVAGVACGREDRLLRIVLPPPPAAGGAPVAAPVSVRVRLPKKASVEYDSSDDEGGNEVVDDGPGGALNTPGGAGIASAVRAALLGFDAGVTTRRLRGAELALASAGAHELYQVTADGISLSAAAVEVLMLLVADRNGVTDATEKLRARLCAPHAAHARVLWPSRWAKGSGAGAPTRRAGRAKTTYAEVEDEDGEGEGAADGAKESFYPFGTIVGASGDSVRASVGCSAALAASLPLWGVQLRGDQPWLVRALRPVNPVVLMEGDHAMVQAQLVDADGRGMPSAQRLMRATILSTPAIPPALSEAVNLQRDSAPDPSHHGHAPPLTLQKRELGRFMQRLSEFEKEARVKASAKLAAKEAGEFDAELADGDKVDERAILAPGTRRGAYHAAAEEIDDFEEEPLQVRGFAQISLLP